MVQPHQLWFEYLKVSREAEKSVIQTEHGLSNLKETLALSAWRLTHHAWTYLIKIYQAAAHIHHNFSTRGFPFHRGCHHCITLRAIHGQRSGRSSWNACDSSLREACLDLPVRPGHVFLSMLSNQLWSSSSHITGKWDYVGKKEAALLSSRLFWPYLLQPILRKRSYFRPGMLKGFQQRSLSDPHTTLLMTGLVSKNKEEV